MFRAFGGAAIAVLDAAVLATVADGRSTPPELLAKTSEGAAEAAAEAAGKA